ncbi:hypothetical protein GLOTRDRAFT_95895 [Gloeophyllum trabeum ATCC 11539]|uniref:Uncharacterized protein n=1 Tax=Gloeophyllum trabeum (strain ATCC 11539 / FP-39264 / Madison 617) TaxID=670483 RepID=S7PY42_GLOTA|nr:uncharacterized protein GLOTRDRAFT_95895 [Gloeophyllum trabeum ATCC 11539]EPQ52272.1 hypothetical protein GLOTRDRAFT_95895 [Gloeophyllum trabeum ATCC 11539]
MPSVPPPTSRQANTMAAQSQPVASPPRLSTSPAILKRYTPDRHEFIMSCFLGAAFCLAIVSATIVKCMPFARRRRAAVGWTHPLHAPLSARVSSGGSEYERPTYAEVMLGAKQAQGRWRDVQPLSASLIGFRPPTDADSVLAMFERRARCLIFQSREPVSRAIEAVQVSLLISMPGPRREESGIRDVALEVMGAR